MDAFQELTVWRSRITEWLSRFPGQPLPVTADELEELRGLEKMRNSGQLSQPPPPDVPPPPPPETVFGLRVVLDPQRARRRGGKDN